MLKITIFCAVFQLITCFTIPSYIQKCSLSDPKIDECLLKATEDIKPHIKNGVPELNLPSLNPFVIPILEVQQGTDAINYATKFVNLQIFGFDNYKFEKFSYNPKTFYFDGLYHFDHLHIETDYETTGKFLGLEISGKGHFVTDISGASGSLTLTGELFEENEILYYKPITAEAKIKISNYTFSFTGLFSENEDLAMAANQFIKENSDEIVKEIMPEIEKIAGEVFFNIVNSYTGQVPYKSLFLD